jgi:hypothetical protein
MAALIARSQRLETQHAFDTTLSLGPRWEMMLHSRLRTEPRGDGLYQVRGGPIFEYSANNRIALLGGYYFTRQQWAGEWSTTHRYFGGAEATAVSARRIDADVRVIAERFAPASSAGFARYRERVRVSGKGRIAPYASVEWFQDRQGFRGVRYSGGLRVRGGRGISVDAGYFFEARHLAKGGDRHMVITAFHFRRPGRRADPDI